MEKENLENLFEKNLTVSISTCGQDGTPWTSTSPYTIIDNTAYIYISKIAEHYYNLKENSNICIMVVESSSEAKNPFVLTRATFKGKAIELEEISENIWGNFCERFSKEMLEKLREINFSMFKINLNTGRYVTGFGKAFDINFVDNTWKQEAVTDVNTRIK